MALITFIILSVEIVVAFNFFKNHRPTSFTSLKSSPLDKYIRQIETPSLEDLFSSSRIKYIDDDSSDNENNMFIMRETVKLEATTATKTLPILPFSDTMFPGSRQFLFIYELRYRALMNEADNIDGGTLVRCFSSKTDRIGKYGSVCKVVEKRRLRDGRGFFIIESMKRCEIQKITKFSPFMMAEVNEEIDDELLSDNDLNFCEELSRDIFFLLKVNTAPFNRVIILAYIVINISILFIPISLCLFYYNLHLLSLQMFCNCGFFL